MKKLNCLPKVHHRFLLSSRLPFTFLGQKNYLRTPSHSKPSPSYKCVCKMGAVWSLTPTSMIANFLKNFRILLIFKPLHREDCTHAATSSAAFVQCMPKKPWKGPELRLIFHGKKILQSFEVHSNAGFRMKWLGHYVSSSIFHSILFSNI